MVRKLPTPTCAQVPVPRSELPVPGLDELLGEALPAQSSPRVIPAPAVTRPAEIKPLAPDRYKVQFTVSRETHDKLRRVQDLMRHTVPNGDPAVIFDRALTLLLAELSRSRSAATDRPQGDRTARPRSRPPASR